MCCGKDRNNATSKNKNSENYILVEFIGHWGDTRRVQGIPSGTYYSMGGSRKEVYIKEADLQSFVNRGIVKPIINNEEELSFSAQTVILTKEEEEREDKFYNNISNVLSEKLMNVEEELYFDFREIEGIGKSTADHLNNAGYTNPLSVVADTFEEFNKKVGEKIGTRTKTIYDNIVKFYEERS